MSYHNPHEPHPDSDDFVEPVASTPYGVIRSEADLLDSARVHAGVTMAPDVVEEPELEEYDHWFAGDEESPRVAIPRRWMPNAPPGMSLAAAAMRGRPWALRAYGKWARVNRGRAKAPRFACSSQRRRHAHHQLAPRRARRNRVRRSSASPSGDGPPEQAARAPHWSPA
jgi:hypothetical protein